MQVAVGDDLRAILVDVDGRRTPTGIQRSRGALKLFPVVDVEGGDERDIAGIALDEHLPAVDDG